MCSILSTIFHPHKRDPTSSPTHEISIWCPVRLRQSPPPFWLGSAWLLGRDRGEKIPHTQHSLIPPRVSSLSTPREGDREKKGPLRCKTTLKMSSRNICGTENSGSLGAPKIHNFVNWSCGVLPVVCLLRGQHVSNLYRKSSTFELSSCMHHIDLYHKIWCLRYLVKNPNILFE